MTVDVEGTASERNTTSFMLDDSPQPDLNLRLLPEYGERVTGGEPLSARCAGASGRSVCLQCLQEGLRSVEHERFVAQFAARRE